MELLALPAGDGGSRSSSLSRRTPGESGVPLEKNTAGVEFRRLGGTLSVSCAGWRCDGSPLARPARGEGPGPGLFWPLLSSPALDACPSEPLLNESLSPALLPPALLLALLRGNIHGKSPVVAALSNRPGAGPANGEADGEATSAGNAVVLDGVLRPLPDWPDSVEKRRGMNGESAGEPPALWLGEFGFIEHETDSKSERCEAEPPGDDAEPSPSTLGDVGIRPAPWMAARGSFDGSYLPSRICTSIECLYECSLRARRRCEPDLPKTPPPPPELVDDSVKEPALLPAAAELRRSPPIM